MALELKIVSEHADLVGDDFVREFHETGGTIGRSLHNDWILPDPDRYISGRHATIDFKGGMYYLADTSSNGVYLNGDVEPLGRGNPRRLFDGDRLRMGDFEFVVAVDSGESLVMPLEPGPTVVPDNIEQLVDEVSLRTGMKLLDEEEMSGDEEFQSALFGGGDVKPKTKKKKEHAIEQELAAKPTNSEEALQVTAEDLFDSFLDGLEISRAELHPSVNRPEMMMQAGQILREFVTGTTDLLTSRANLKNTFRLDQTTVLPRQNNPMKFSDNTADLLKQLLVGGDGDYLGARDAVREVCRDLINHQNAFLDAMNSAFVEFADRFDPEELQEGFDRTLGGGLFSFGKNAKYWNLYQDLYPIITEKGGGRFPQMFAEEFVKAYERQVAEYQRFDRDGTAATGSYDDSDQDAVDPGLMATQKLDTPMGMTEETAFESDDVVDSLSATAANAIDENFVEELDNSMSKEIAQDQLKA
ncbi:MAG: type VI secretion system-associated FHA domain protein TagH [Gammaproteobacteria bacterium]|nr:type VI secretion system-associated FHA domain protein TagH [Gammaproteobacteria bacterium]